MKYITALKNTTNRLVSIKYLLLAIFYSLLIMSLSYSFTHAYFSGAANSSGNIFAAASVFPTTSTQPSTEPTISVNPSVTVTPSVTPSTSPTPPTINPGDIVINEIMWMGTASNSADEWVELRNTTANTIDLSSWIIENLGPGNNSITVPSGKSISPNGFFLIANDTKEAGGHNIDPDYVTNIGISNSPSEQLILRVSAAGAIIDTADNNAGDWFAGENGIGQNPDKSMERNDTPDDGTIITNWHTATSATNMDADTDDLATPKAANSTP